MGWPTTVAKGTFHVATRPVVWPVKGVAWSWNKLPKGAKTSAGVVAALAAATGFLAYESMKGARGSEFREGTDEQIAQIPPMLTPQDLMMQMAPQEQLSGPAEGRGEFEFRNRVLAGRGQALEQPQVNAVQPRMSAIDPQSVTELGAPKPMGV